MRRRFRLLALMPLLLLAFSARAEKTFLTLTPVDGGVEYRFSIPDDSFAVLKYKAPRESGQQVIYGEDGDFSGVLSLPCSGEGDTVKVTIENLQQRQLAEGKTALTAGENAVPEGESDIKKVEGLVLTERPEGFAYEFYAPGTDFMELRWKNKQQSASVYVYPADDTGRYAGEIGQPLTYARTLTTVTVHNGKGREAAKGEVRKGYQAPPVPEETTGRLSGVTVCVDPGHQENGQVVREPNGPGLPGYTTVVPGCAQGRTTLRKEHIVVLEIGMKLRDELIRQGAKVVMTRETQDVYHTNIERCEIAKAGGADIMLRLHADLVENRNKRGISIHAPLNSEYARRVAEPTAYREMGQKLIDAMKRAVGYELSDKTGYVKLGDGFIGNNWAEMPCFLVEMGYMSNMREDQLLSQPVYQQWLAEGMAQGVYEIALLRGWVTGQ